MDATTQGLLLLLLGVVIGAVPVLAWRVSDRQLRDTQISAANTDHRPVVPSGVAAVLGVLRSAAVVLDERDQVLMATAPAYALGLIRDGELREKEIGALVRQVRRDGDARRADLELQRGTGRTPTSVHARVAALSERMLLVLVEDRTRERRVEAIRRDFVANVSHELKTPIGAMTLLAEALLEAAEDPEAVERFARRMKTEASRLGNLVQQIIELSRLQELDLGAPEVVPVDAVVARALDAVGVEARAKNIEVVDESRPGLRILGDADQIALALKNLVANAITYSTENSRVSVQALPGDLTVDITVTDEGIGIPPHEIDRIFERFYRVDPARRRTTGGTGLGLSIVKHVAASHGGEVTVWSQEGEGSSFTLRLPRAVESTGIARPADRPAPRPAPAEEVS